MTVGASFDVVVVGEVLVEMSATEPLRHATAFRRSFAGDALNAAAAAVASGARAALMTRVGEDDFGAALLDHATSLGVDVSLTRTVAAANGVYFQYTDPEGAHQFVYARKGSAASTMEPSDVDDVDFSDTRVLVTTGIGRAISASAADTILRAAEAMRASGGTVIYDPNHRPRLESPSHGRRSLETMCRIAQIVTPSCPADSEALLGTRDPRDAARACLDLGAASAIVTCGPRGALVTDERADRSVSAPTPSVLVDATGAGDVLVGTVAAQIAQGHDLDEAARAGVDAATRSLAGRGGTGWLADRDEAERVVGA